MHWASATGDGSKVKQIKVNTVVMDFVASLSLLTRGIQGGIATFARVTMAVMVGYPPQSYSQVLGAPIPVTRVSMVGG